MRRLLYANCSRLYGSKAFRVTLILMLCLEGILSLLLLSQDSTRIDLALFVSIQGIGSIISVSLSLFYGTEYSDGTIRNKLIVGHKRTDIYLAGFLSGGMGITMLYMLWILVGMLFAVIMQIPVTITFKCVVSGCIGWLACISYCAIYNMIGMLSSSKAKTAIICILSAFCLMFGGLLCYSLARQGLLSEPMRMLFEVLFDINPYGQIFQFMTVELSVLWRLGIYAILVIVCVNTCGIAVFHKKDIK